jgi:hypothetical protein
MVKIISAVVIIAILAFWTNLKPKYETKHKKELNWTVLIIELDLKWD